MPVYWASLLKTPNFLSPSPEDLNFEEARLQNLETGVGYRLVELTSEVHGKGHLAWGPWRSYCQPVILGQGTRSCLCIMAIVGAAIDVCEPQLMCF